jgi:hypothetical protein
MIVSLVWPNYSVHESDQGAQPVDAFWVQCDVDDAVEKVMPAITDKRFDPEAKTPTSAEFGPGFCFLVARDLTSVVQMPWVYPYSGLWNAYCPFRRLPESLTIDSLDELCDIVVPEELRR